MKKKIERECVFRGEFFFLYIYIYSANREFFTMNGEKLNFVYNFFGTRFGFFLLLDRLIHKFLKWENSNFFKAKFSFGERIGNTESSLDTFEE